MKKIAIELVKLSVTSSAYLLLEALIYPLKNGPEYLQSRGLELLWAYWLALPLNPTALAFFVWAFGAVVAKQRTAPRSLVLRLLTSPLAIASVGLAVLIFTASTWASYKYVGITCLLVFVVYRVMWFWLPRLAKIIWQSFEQAQISKR